MNLEPLRAALSAEAEAGAEQRRTEAEASGARRLAEARAQADAIVKLAGQAAEQTAAQEVGRRHAAASRRARELRLEGERSLRDELRERAHEAALALRTDPGYPQLLERLSRAAKSQLGPGAELEIDPPQLGGVVARAGGVLVDYSLPALVDRTIDELGADLEGLRR